jgi:hypothetical protein
MRQRSWLFHHTMVPLDGGATARVPGNVVPPEAGSSHSRWPRAIVFSPSHVCPLRPHCGTSNVRNNSRPPRNSGGALAKAVSAVALGIATGLAASGLCVCNFRWRILALGSHRPGVDRHRQVSTGAAAARCTPVCKKKYAGRICTVALGCICIGVCGSGGWQVPTHAPSSLWRGSTVLPPNLLSSRSCLGPVFLGRNKHMP